jgi:hypothetical protein
MPTRKLSITDQITYGVGLTVKGGISGERHITIGDNLIGYILLESGDRILSESGDGLLTDVPEID